MAPSHRDQRRRLGRAAHIRGDYTQLVAKASTTNAAAAATPPPKLQWYYYVLLLFTTAVVAFGVVVIVAAVGKFWFFSSSGVDSTTSLVASSTGGLGGSNGGTSSQGVSIVKSQVSSTAVVVPSYTLHTNTSWPVTSIGNFVVGQLVTITTSSTPSVTLTGQVVAVSATPYPTIVVYGLSVTGPNQGAAVQGWIFSNTPSSSSAGQYTIQQPCWGSLSLSARSWWCTTPAACGRAAATHLGCYGAFSNAP